MEQIPGGFPQNTLFPSAKKLVFANMSQSYRLLMSMDFLSVTRVEIFLVPLHADIREKFERLIYVWMTRRLLALPRLASLLLPVDSGSEDCKPRSVENSIRRGVRVKYI